MELGYLARAHILKARARPKTVELLCQEIFSDILIYIFKESKKVKNNAIYQLFKINSLGSYVELFFKKKKSPPSPQRTEMMHVFKIQKLVTCALLL